MTGWIALFAVQTLLISSHRVRTHRALGMFGAGYAVLVVIMGCTATVLAARREVLAHSQFVSGFLSVLALELTQMFLFASHVGLAVLFRNRGGYHKRLMLLNLLHPSKSHRPAIHMGRIWQQHHHLECLGFIGDDSRIARFDQKSQVASRIRVRRCDYHRFSIFRVLRQPYLALAPFCGENGRVGT